MREISELIKTGVHESFSPKERKTINDLLKELNLEGKYFGVLVNGKRADLDTKIKPSDEITILPHIAGCK